MIFFELSPLSVVGFFTIKTAPPSVTSVTSVTSDVILVLVRIDSSGFPPEPELMLNKLGCSDDTLVDAGIIKRSQSHTTHVISTVSNLFYIVSIPYLGYHTCNIYKVSNLFYIQSCS